MHILHTTNTSWCKYKSAPLLMQTGGMNEKRPHIESSLFILLPTHPSRPFIQLGWLMDKKQR